MPSIEIVDNSDDKIVTPFAIPDYQEIKSGKSNNSEFLYFDIKATQENADSLSIAVYFLFWLDIIINRNMTTIDVELRVNHKDGGKHGTGEFAPQDAQNEPVYQRLSQNSPLRNRHHQVKGFIALKHLVLSCLQRYWSRTIALQGNSIYRLNVNPVDTKQNAMDDIEFIYNTNRGWKRYSNPGSVRGLYSLVTGALPQSYLKKLKRLHKGASIILPPAIST